MITPVQSQQDPRRRNALHLIALFEALKGLLAVVAASGLGFLGPEPVQRSISFVIQRFELDPNHGPLPSLLRLINPSAVRLVAVLLLIYAALRFWETWGLWRMRAWASILGCVSVAIYLPIDIFAVIRHPGWTAWLVLAFNLFVIFYLLHDLRARKRAGH